MSALKLGSSKCSFLYLAVLSFSIQPANSSSSSSTYLMTLLLGKSSWNLWIRFHSVPRSSHTFHHAYHRLIKCLTSPRGCMLLEGSDCKVLGPSTRSAHINAQYAFNEKMSKRITEMRLYYLIRYVSSWMRCKGSSCILKRIVVFLSVIYFCVSTGLCAGGGESFIESHSLCDIKKLIKWEKLSRWF